MKARFCDLASRFDMHPADLLLYAQGSGASLEACWPTMDESIVETLQRTFPQIFVPESVPEADRAIHPPIEEPHSAESDRKAPHTRRIGKLTHTSLKLLDKLHCHNKWGEAGVSMDAIKNDFPHESQNVEDAVWELFEKGLIVASPDNGRYGLNPRMRKRIDILVTAMKKRE